MPRIAGVATAVPDHVLGQHDAKERVLKMFGPVVERLLPVFDNAQIDTRHFAKEIEWFESPHDFPETNDLYIEETLNRAEWVVNKLAQNCGIDTTDFDAIFFVSTTGLSTPSID